MAFLTKNEIEKMDFSNLLKYTELQLNNLETDDKKFVYFKEELLNLCEVLNNKIINEYQKALSIYNNPPEPYPPFTPSARLLALREQRAQFQEQLHWKKSKIKRTYGEQRKTYREMENVLKEIKKLNIQEMEEYKNRKKTDENKYDLAIKEYYENKNKTELVEQQKRQARNLEVEKIRQRILNHFDLRKAKNVRRLNWQILPPGEWSIEQITKHFKAIENTNSTRKYDLERLELLKALKPTTCYIGLEEFVGYVVFCFDYTEKAILENPITGNAIYVINNNWQEMSQLTKRELLSYHSGKVTRIIHRGNWFERLEIKITNS